MSAALIISTCPLGILLIILIIFAVKTKRRLCTKSNNSLACWATTDLTVGLIVLPLTMTNFSLMHIGGRIQTVTCTLINKLWQPSNSRLQEYTLKAELITKGFPRGKKLIIIEFSVSCVALKSSFLTASNFSASFSPALSFK